NDSSQMRLLLDQCPQDLRGWEWHYLNRLFHASLRTEKVHQYWALAVAYSPDGKYLATCGGIPDVFSGANPSDPPGELKVWDAVSGKEIANLGKPTSVVTAVAFSPDGRLLAAAT